MLRQQKQNDVSLRVFLSSNDKVLAAFGVFGALTLLFTAFTNELLYFISLFLFLVLCYEFNTSFPSWRLSTIYLFLFRILCWVLFFVVLGYSSYFYFFRGFAFVHFFIVLCVWLCLVDFTKN
ncbi:MAG: hypothetical protein CW716_12955 [Candidatus Bathyarchaeum sp.]|nr:MAG: hypothetical protein CW716_12955 [Candidatus Bathyarchaeum sp.]